MRFRFNSNIYVFSILFLIACCGRVPPLSQEDRRLYIDNYDSQLLLARTGDCDAELQMAHLIKPELFLSTAPTLLSEDDRFHVAIAEEAAWLRKAVLAGCKEALTELSLDYMIGIEPFPKDRELGLCYKEAENNIHKIPGCNRLEIERRENYILNPY